MAQETIADKHFFERRRIIILFENLGMKVS
jgi:hypothetical protein